MKRGIRKGMKHVGHELRVADNLLMRNFQNQLHAITQEENCTMMQSWILCYLDQHQQQDVFQKDIEIEFSIGRSTVTNILQLMEKNGYITRQSVENDARLKKLVLTSKGYEIHCQIVSCIDHLEKENIQGVEKEELERFYTTLDKIKNNAERQLRELDKNISSTN